MNMKSWEGSTLLTEQSRKMSVYDVPQDTIYDEGRKQWFKKYNVHEETKWWSKKTIN